MKSRESQIATQVRLAQWAQEIQDCMNRPKNMTVNEWCEQHNIKKTNYYWRLKRVRQACLEQTKTSTRTFVELPAPTEQSIQAPVIQEPVDNSLSTAAVLHSSGGISVEIKECASVEFLKNMIGALANAE